MKKTIVSLLIILSVTFCFGQDYRWQQRVEYTMNVHLDVASGQMSGTQKLVYFNNSPDTLTKVYYHLYFNAFQPGSMMDVRSRALADPDRRVADRISKLSDKEIGYQHILSLTQDSKSTTFNIQGTVLEVTLAKPILPKTKTVFDMKFESQVPLQVRRSGRDNREGIAYSMTQWYPKLAEYDFQGWHAYQYVAREFHGVWGDFDVTISIDPAFIIAGTGKLQNPEKIGFGYEKPGSLVTKSSGDLSWHFNAKNVIDFAWTADPDYTHDRVMVPDGPELHFFYQKNEKTKDTWKKMEEYAVRNFQYMNQHFGKYPFDTYSIIQGGDGGMEYPMCTLILGEGTLAGLTGTMAHEVAHSWFQMTLASNESLYSWMDEGFSDFASGEAYASYMNWENPHAGSYAAYFSLVASGLQEPASQAADHFNTNRAYSTTSYSMGAVFLYQLSYIIGKENFEKGMIRYYNTWKMKHPEPNDFVRVMEKTSGLQLHWYLRYWIGTTKKIDYGINSVTERDGNSFVTLERVGEFPMPVDLLVTYADGTKEMFYVSMNELLGNKPQEDKNIPRTVSSPWPWVNPSYVLKINKPAASVTSIEIDPSLRMADINRKNNKWIAAEKTTEYKNQPK
ncbi:MAG: M1 family metallopeptidase [Cyclobacteriaceae bacterium]|nr:M1 family metallopeptidase [Cyclobacteriaceae bacterium]